MLHKILFIKQAEFKQKMVQVALKKIRNYQLIFFFQEIMDSAQEKLTLQKQHKEFETAHVSESMRWRKSEIISVWQV